MRPLRGQYCIAYKPERADRDGKHRTAAQNSGSRESVSVRPRRGKQYIYFVKRRGKLSAFCKTKENTPLIAGIPDRQSAGCFLLRGGMETQHGGAWGIHGGEQK